MNFWQSALFAAGHFTASGSMTWTVASGDVAVNRYAYDAFNQSFAWQFYVVTSTVGGTPSTGLRIANPLGLTSARTVASPCWISDNGVAVQGLAVAEAGTAYISIQRKDSGNFAAATNNTIVLGQILYSVGSGGSWVDETSYPGQFETNSAAAWTIGLADYVTVAYQMNNRSMHLAVWLELTSLDLGTATELRMDIPNSRVAVNTVSAPFWYRDNGTQAIGRMQVQAGLSYVRFMKQDPTAAWAASTNNTSVIGTITFEAAAA